MVGYIIIAAIAIAVGFILGLRSKAQAKIRERNINNMPGHRNAPPPPPSRFIREGEEPPKPNSEHVRPRMSYDANTYVRVNKCSNCNAIGRELDMWNHNPCPKCGGAVKTHGAAKWVGKFWEMSRT
jgi:hypothetical protein